MPKISKKFQKILKNSQKFLKIPKYSKYERPKYQKVKKGPKRGKNLQMAEIRRRRRKK